MRRAVIAVASLVGLAVLVVLLPFAIRASESTDAEGRFPPIAPAWYQTAVMPQYAGSGPRRFFHHEDSQFGDRVVVDGYLPSGISPTYPDRFDLRISLQPGIGGFGQYGRVHLDVARLSAAVKKNLGTTFTDGFVVPARWAIDSPRDPKTNKPYDQPGDFDGFNVFVGGSFGVERTSDSAQTMAFPVAFLGENGRKYMALLTVEFAQNPKPTSLSSAAL